MKTPPSEIMPKGAYNTKSLSFYFDLIFQRTKADLKAEASRGYLGMLWWILEPIMYMFVFYIVFSHIRSRGDESLVLFLLTGLVPWKWFLSSVLVGAKSLMGNVFLMNQVYLPKIVFPLTSIFANTVKFMIVLTIFMIFLIFFSDSIYWTWLILPGILLMQLLFITSFTTFLSGIVPFFPDLRMILPNLMLMIFLLSGIFFDISDLPQKTQSILYLNPMARIISIYRDILLFGNLPAVGHVIFIVSLSFIMLIAACWLLFRYDRIYPKIIH